MKLSFAAEEEPAFVTEALEPGAPVLVDPTLTLAAAPAGPLEPFVPFVPLAPRGPAGPAGPRTFQTTLE